MKNKFFITLVAILFACGLNHLGSHALHAQENNYAQYVSSETWGGTYGQYGVNENWNGISLSYDGWYTKALNPNYVSVEMNYVNFMKSIPTTSGYAQESIFDFGFLTSQYTTPDWARTKKGLFLLTRNIDGNVYVQISLNGNNSSSNAIIFEQTLDLKVSDFSSLTLKGNSSSTQIFINDIKIQSEALDSLSSQEYCDVNGYTFFALESYSAGGSGTDVDKRLLNLSYVKEFESQIPDPSIVSPDKPLVGEDDYEAPVGLGLTAKKYSADVLQTDDGVIINKDAVLYTPLVNGLIEEKVSLKEASNIRIGLDGTQKVLSLEDTIPLAIYLKNDNGIKASNNGIDYTSVNSAVNQLLTIRFSLVDDKYCIYVNDVIFQTDCTALELTGPFGTFIKYSLTEGDSLEIIKMHNPVISYDVCDQDNWNSPFGGITKQEDETIVFAHSTLKTPFDKDYLSFEFKINGLLDTSTATALIGFELMANYGIYDPWQVSSNGIVVLFRIYNGDLQFKIDLYTEFMGTIAIHDWTDLDIDPTERIKLTFINDEENDGYRILFNDIEVKGSKMAEIITIDASNRDSKSYLGVALWHDTTVVNENILNERSIIVYSIDNVLDENDIPSELRSVGEDPEQPAIEDNSEEKSEEITTSENSNPTPSKKKGCKGSTSSVLSIFALALLMRLKKKREIIK